MNSRTVSVVGSTIVSIMVCLAFLVALAVAFLSKDSANLGMLLGVIAGGFTSVLGFWLGSSNGSQRKDDIIARSVPLSSVTVGTKNLTDSELNTLADAFVAKTSNGPKTEPIPPKPAHIV